MFIKVWCEYEIQGQFGGNNDQEILELKQVKSEFEIDKMVEAFVKERCDEISSGLYGWESVNIGELG